MISGKEVAATCDVSERFIRQKTKEALESGVKAIAIGERAFVFTTISSKETGGIAYRYEERKEPTTYKAKELVNALVLENPIKPTTVDKITIIKALERSGMTQNAFRELVNTLYHDMNLTLVTLKRWKKSFKDGGVKQLQDKRGGNARKADMEIVRQVILAHGLITFANLYEMYKLRDAIKENLEIKYFLAKGRIAYSTFLRAAKKTLKEDRNLYVQASFGLDNLHSEVVAFARKGIKKPNQEWQIDASPLDYMVKAKELYIEEGEVKEKWVNRRMTAIAIVDTYTGRRVWGLYNSANSNADARLIKKAIMKLGKPTIIKGDNGKDFVSKHLQGVFDELGIHYIKGRPYKGADKGKVERNFKTIFHGKFELLRDTFIGHNVTDRQRLESQALSKDKRLGGDKTYLETPYTDEEFEMMIDKYIDAESELNGWDALWGDFQQEIIPEDILNLYMGKRKEVRVGREGIRYNNIIYFSPRFVNEGMINTTRVIISEDMDNIANIHVFSLDGEYLCDAINRDVLNLSVEEAREHQKVHTKQLKEYEKASKRLAKEDQTIIEGFMGLDDIKKEIAAKEAKAITKKEERTIIDAATSKPSKNLQDILLAQYEETRRIA